MLLKVYVLDLPRTNESKTMYKSYELHPLKLSHHFSSKSHTQFHSLKTLYTQNQTLHSYSKSCMEHFCTLQLSSASFQVLKFLLLHSNAQEWAPDLSYPHLYLSIPHSHFLWLPYFWHICCLYLCEEAMVLSLFGQEG